ncbi:hypothetical protein FPQ10_05490 [Allobacillus sp. SKP2-8]|uniref:hypothetical protein n=1 Tax=unclassified Allobacillus TaxID=2628859 RepID=UPI001182738A|nr:hypothetical protein [Allobacillus sp. SKP2-8]TSJ68004.1 hypothetical protein FPQ10_05490 [Allobacillus sp. SKP2-8]
MRKQTLTVIQPITCQRDAADRGQLFSFYVERLERFVERFVTFVEWLERFIERLERIIERFPPVCRAVRTRYRAVAPHSSSG